MRFLALTLYGGKEASMELDHSLHINSITKDTTLRQLLCFFADCPIPKKLPSARQLASEGEVFRMLLEEGVLCLYRDGCFSYTTQGRTTVQYIKNCLHPIQYVFAKTMKDETISIGTEFFMDLPFYIRLIYEGEERITRNISDRERKRVYTYDNVDNSIDLEDPDGDCSISIIEKIINEKRDEMLKKALDSLTSRQYKVVIMYYQQGMTQQQIADILNCRKQSVNECLKRALTKLRAYLEVT